jgi:hypothetical protein
MVTGVWGMDRRVPVVTALTIDECKKVASPLREGLEMFDYDVRSIVAGLLGDAERAEIDNVVFAKAMSTVLLSIAAGLLAGVGEDEGLVFEADAFVKSAQDAAHWAKMRKIRYYSGGEA